MSLVATSGHAYPGPPAAVETPTGAVGTGRTVMSASKPPETKAPVVRKQRQEGSGAGKSQPAQQPKARPVSPAAAPKGIAKPISVRVFENGEYGDQKTDRFPYRTITLRPTHKTMRAVMNTIDRELAWNSVGKKVDVIYDATGCEITSVDQLTNGQAIVASAGDRFVIPHPSSILHEEVVKLSMASSSAPNPVA
uniref:Doublecortin domain-containing protein n=1 Tax=Trypanosoma congolense (strain IL3000) TaxID=1068625 RepID=G0UK74_TRYCI|nr:conserved hypothetical protein [Trypanosoma congolense IL3000]